jgi:hypothetical protein
MQKSLLVNQSQSSLIHTSSSVMVFPIFNRSSNLDANCLHKNFLVFELSHVPASIHIHLHSYILVKL